MFPIFCRYQQYCSHFSVFQEPPLIKICSKRSYCISLPDLPVISRTTWKRSSRKPCMAPPSSGMDVLGHSPGTSAAYLMLPFPGRPSGPVLEGVGSPVGRVPGCWGEAQGWEHSCRLPSRQKSSFSFDYAMFQRGAWVCSSAFLHPSADGNEAGGLERVLRPGQCVFGPLLLTCPFLLHLPLPHVLFLFLFFLFSFFIPTPTPLN